MKALLLKDGYVLWKNMRFFLLLILIVAAVPTAFYSTFVVIWAAMLPYTAAAYDRASRWDRLAAMMPYSVRDLVLCKYVLGWLCVAAAAAAALLLPGLTVPVIRHFWAGAVPAPSAAVLLSLCAALIILAVMLPMFYRFGAEKGRLVMMVVIGLVCGFASFISNLTGGAGSLAAVRAPVMLLAPALAAVLTAVSVPLSMRFYARYTE